MQRAPAQPSGRGRVQILNETLTPRAGPTKLASIALPSEVVMSRGIFATPIVPAMNAVAAKLIDVPLLGNVVRRNLVVISYVGRRSGKTFSIPVNYRRAGDEVVIHVGLPGAKTWWRNFLGDGGPITLRLNGTDQTGHAVATRDDQGRVTVTVKL